MKGGPHCLVSSPARLSTLTTSAPRSANNWPAHGPARTRASSTTFKPASGAATLQTPLQNVAAAVSLVASMPGRLHRRRHLTIGQAEAGNEQHDREQHVQPVVAAIVRD